MAEGVDNIVSAVLQRTKDDSQFSFNDWGYVSSLSEQSRLSLQSSFDATKQEHSGSIISKIAPKLNTTVSAAAVQNHHVSMTKANAGANIDPSRTALMSVNQAAQGVKNSISIMLQSAKQSVIAAIKNNPDMSPAYENLFMDRRVSSTGLEVAANAAMSGQSISGLLDLVYSQQAGSSRPKDPDVMMAEVLDMMRSQSVPAKDHPDSGIGYMAALSPVPEDQTTFDWSDVTLDEFKAIMLADPENPNEEMFPEVKALNSLQQTIGNELENLEVVEQAVALDARVDPDFYERQNAVLLTNIVQLSLDKAPEVDEEVSARFHHEPDMNKLVPQLQNSFRPVA